MRISAMMDQAYYASFRDNQVGKDNFEDDNAANFAIGKLNLLPAVTGSEIVIAVATPSLPETSATIGTVMKDGNSLVLPIDIWLPDDSMRSKTFNGRTVQMLYLPPLPAGKYKLQVQWRTMAPPHYGDGSDYSRIADQSRSPSPSPRTSPDRAAGPLQN